MCITFVVDSRSCIGEERDKGEAANRELEEKDLANKEVMWLTCFGLQVSLWVACRQKVLLPRDDS